MRIGIDLGGTKTEVVALDAGGTELIRRRVPTPKDDYDAVIRTMRDLVLGAEAELEMRGTVGVAIPGTISPTTGLVKNANSTRLIGHPLDKDLAHALAREVRVANDANCFALSEATDGAAAGADIVFGIIAGTGVGGGVCVGGRVLIGAHAIAGEWGHNPLPRPTLEEVRDAPRCYCGRAGCIEAWCSGPALEAQYEAKTGRMLKATEIADDPGPDAAPLFDAWLDRFARAVASLVNVLDPDAVVIGGGLSKIARLYEELPARVEAYAFSPQGPTRIVQAIHGDSSGVRGAAWLWPEK
ncbi:MAG: ROK family protein [Alphaproteobacteria bacterium]|nr:ROK family protein [Alphaproteobacteria bacterium]